MEKRSARDGSWPMAGSTLANGWDGAAATGAGRPDCNAAAPVCDLVRAPF